MKPIGSAIWHKLLLCWFCACGSFASQSAAADPSTAQQILEPNLLHGRSGSEREWSDFPEKAERQRFEIEFNASKNNAERTLILRQQDVKQVWQVRLNDRKLGELARDENDMLVPFAIPPGTLTDVENRLTIEAQPSSKPNSSDDIRVGEIAILDCPLRDYLQQGRLEVVVVDADSNEPLPCRITIVNARGAMQSVGNVSDQPLAIRPGIVFSPTGRASFGLPVGQYTIYAGRGFEYSLDQADVTVSAGESARLELSIRREVPTAGYVASDTHVHTLTHSGHGDATIEERMITLASEGIELPIAADHNKMIDYEPTAVALDVRKYFTPIVGCEVTTPRGHFNIFPVAPGARAVDARQTDWGLLMDEIEQTPGVKVAILNHARDMHSNVRPFGPKHYNALVAENLDGWPLRFNAMEVVNSGAVQSDPLRLFHDWMGLLNRGLQVTSVGSSDSHDVGRHFVGQGRTYIRCNDSDVAALDKEEAVSNFLAGRVMVSYGLLAEITVNARHHSGDFVVELEGDQVRVDVRVLGPHWSQADRVLLFANGQPIREATIEPSSSTGLPVGVKWIGGWTIPKPAHDVHLVAIATGPGIDGWYWRTAKPYQPLSPTWQGRTIGCSGAVWLDADGDRRRSSSREYAERVVTSAGRDLVQLVAELAKYDETVAAHAAHLVRGSGVSLESEAWLAAVKSATPATASGFQAYREAVRENEVARLAP